MKRKRFFRLGFVGMLTTTGLTLGLISFVCTPMLMQFGT